MNDALVSIIVPVYNVEKYLPKCLDSLICQTYKNIEIICVNDGSPDNSLAILEAYAKKDERIRIISQENKGASEARNNALNNANGEYIMFVDGDDWVDTDTIEIAFNTLKEHNADVVMWDYVREFENASLPKNIYKENKIFKDGDIRLLHRKFAGPVGSELKTPENADALAPACVKLYKRECIYDYDIRFFDIRKIGTYEDGLFNFEIFQNIKKVVYINKPLYHYRKNNSGSTTSVYKENLISQHELVHKYILEQIKQKSLDSSYETALSNRIALELVGYGLNILHLKKDRIKKIKSIIKNPYYKDAYNQLEFKYFPIHWKLFYGFAKHGFATGVYLLLLCIKKILGR